MSLVWQKEGDSLRKRGMFVPSLMRILGMPSFMRISAFRRGGGGLHTTGEGLKPQGRGRSAQGLELVHDHIRVTPSLYTKSSDGLKQAKTPLCFLASSIRELEPPTSPIWCTSYTKRAMDLRAPFPNPSSYFRGLKAPPTPTHFNIHPAQRDAIVEEEAPVRPYVVQRSFWACEFTTVLTGYIVAFNS